MLRALWWHTYYLEVNQEAEDGWNNTISESDNLTCPAKNVHSKVWMDHCSESFPPQSHFPLLPHIFVFGKPYKWKREIRESLHKNVSDDTTLCNFPARVGTPWWAPETELKPGHPAPLTHTKVPCAGLHGQAASLELWSFVRPWPSGTDSDYWQWCWY